MDNEEVTMAKIKKTTKKEKIKRAKTSKRITRVRDYKKEYAEYHSKPEQRANRSNRNKARRKLGLKVGDPREADHIKPIDKGGSNAKGNLRAVSRKINRVKYNK